MRVQDIILAEKCNITAGEWGSGKYSKGKFPLSKAGRRAYALGSSWRWRFLEFDAAGQHFVIRVIINEAKVIARAHLALKGLKDCTVLCCYEYHPDLKIGWHLHTLCGDKNDLTVAPAGTLVHGPWVKRLPAVTHKHRRTVFTKDMMGGPEAWLWHETMRFFHVESKGTLV